MLVVITVRCHRDMRKSSSYRASDDREDIRPYDKIIFYDWPASSYDQIKDMLCKEDFVNGFEMRYDPHPTVVGKKVWSKKRSMILQNMDIKCVTEYLEGNHYAP